MAEAPWAAGPGRLGPGPGPGPGLSLFRQLGKKGQTIMDVDLKDDQLSIDPDLARQLNEVSRVFSRINSAQCVRLTFSGLLAFYQ